MQHPLLPFHCCQEHCQALWGHSPLQCLPLLQGWQLRPQRLTDEQRQA